LRSGIVGRRTVAAFVLAVTIMAALAILMDWHEVGGLIGHAKLGPIPIALLFTALSYITFCYGFATVGRLFGLGLPKSDLALAGFVSSVVANLISLGGIAGYSMRIIVLGRRGLRSAEVLGPSIFHSYLTNLFLVAMLPVGLGTLVFLHPLSKAVEIELGAAAGALLLLFGTGSAALFSTRFRRSLLRRAERVYERLLKRKPAATLWELDETLTRGVAAAERAPATLIVPIALAILDWACCLAAIYCCFRALGAHIAPGVLLTGFSVGVVAGLISMIPGGLGVQEGSMAGVYALLGIQFEQALLASILFRVVYYFVPYLASLMLYRRLFGAGGRRADSDRPASSQSPPE
jgi:uncharacterized protein (TIRG00374 family)